MERKAVFIPGEFYHIFSRGTEKRKIFMEKSDYERFLALLYILNQDKTFQLSQFLKRGQKNILDIYEKQRAGNLVSILAYSLMPNHFHLIIQENNDGGITKFMSRLLTAHSMYFNTKYERSGSLFVHPFRSVHIYDDIHFKHLFSYVHLNCLDLFQSNWKTDGIANISEANKFLSNYRYSSYQDFISNHERTESQIVTMEKINYFIKKTHLNIEEYQTWLKT